MSEKSSYDQNDQFEEEENIGKIISSAHVDTELDFKDPFKIFDRDQRDKLQEQIIEWQ